MEPPPAHQAMHEITFIHSVPEYTKRGQQGGNGSVTVAGVDCGTVGRERVSHSAPEYTRRGQQGGNRSVVGSTTTRQSTLWDSGGGRPGRHVSQEVERVGW